MRRKKLINCCTSMVVTESKKASFLSLQKCQMMCVGCWMNYHAKKNCVFFYKFHRFSVRKLGRVYWKISDISFRA